MVERRDRNVNYPERANLRLSTYTYAGYARMAKLQGNTVTAFMREVLDSGAPRMHEMADALEMALRGDAEGVTLFKRVLADLEADAALQHGRAERLEERVVRGDDAAAGVGAAAGDAASAAPDPAVGSSALGSGQD